MGYKTGLFGGSFDPLHLGHLRVILQAAASCQRLYLVLSWCRKRDSVPMEYRYRWLCNVTKHLGNVTILPLEDTSETKEAYLQEGGWQESTRQIVAAIGSMPEVVFCGSDYVPGHYESLYPGAKVIYMERTETNISSSQIRKEPLRYWDMLPREVQPYYVKTVLIVGSESTGKTTLAKNLALHFNTAWVEEAGRQICAEAGGEKTMVAEDLHKCLLYQKTSIWEKKKEANRVLFVDTDAVTTSFYIRFLLREGTEREQAEALASAVASTTRFDLVLFLEPTVEFVQDGTRSERIAAERKTYSDELRAAFDRAGVRLIPVGGDYADRFHRAVTLTEEVIGNGTYD